MTTQTRSVTTGRAPTARVAKAATEMEDHGFNLEIDRDNEREFTFDPSLQGVDTDTALAVARQIVDDNRLEMYLEGGKATIHVPN